MCHVSLWADGKLKANEEIVFFLRGRKRLYANTESTRCHWCHKMSRPEQVHQTIS